ncbi:SMP-30/gluconolactonase/LRE family protein [Mucilaginibacter lacusdianchii]|uniref:SMP-30/gluconolactonase/LRE family protein n=1 Tax=Mucilaginibacter lacusdianchii TaxID=2684211 RepID=UPI00131D0041|nr:L-dopachrome tautomerase-related protein [Mucilaginibacter sp. JXJ CY 39]
MAQLEKVFADDTYQLTGVAISAEGRLFTNYPLWSDVYKYALVEVMPDGSVTPYPNEVMNSWKDGESGMDKWVCVQAVYIDSQNTMWVVDPAAPFMEKVYQNKHKLVKINLATNTVERVYPFEGITSEKSYINDVRVDTEKQIAYLTNSNEGGITVLDLETGKGRELLKNHYSVKTDPSFTFMIDGHELMKKGEPAKMQSDGIALSPDGEWLYYKPLTDNKLYRIKTEHLRNEDLSDEELESKVEDLGSFATTDGMAFDTQGNLYLGDLQNYALLKITPDLQMSTFLKDEQLIWPDSYSLSKDGKYLYVSTSQIQKQPDYNNGENKRTSPHKIFKVKL